MKTLTTLFIVTFFSIAALPSAKAEELPCESNPSCLENAANRIESQILPKMQELKEHYTKELGPTLLSFLESSYDPSYVLNRMVEPVFKGNTSDRELGYKDFVQIMNRESDMKALADNLRKMAANPSLSDRYTTRRSLSYLDYLQDRIDYLLHVKLVSFLIDPMLMIYYQSKIDENNASEILAPSCVHSNIYGARLVEVPVVSIEDTNTYLSFVARAARGEADVSCVSSVSGVVGVASYIEGHSLRIIGNRWDLFTNNEIAAKDILNKALRLERIFQKQ